MAESLAPAPGLAPDIAAGRRSAAALAAAFADAAPPLTPAQALVEAERCLYCHDAPCTQICPTGIEVPSFIRRIADGNLRGAARTILDANPLGGTCARVCPTEVLCEDVCVRRTQHGRPVEIGRLQRHAVDAVMARPVTTLFARAAPTGRRIAVIGAGPAGIACAFMLARRGHDVVVHDARPLAGGLNAYGLAAYKMAGDFAQAELDWLLAVGGVTLQLNWRLASAAQLAALRARFDTVYLALGLTRTATLGIDGEQLAGVRDAVDFIAELRQAPDLATLPIGRRVIVIGGGMTAVDAAVQSRLLGAESVQMVYRRGPEQMSASLAEREWAQTQGVTIRHHLAPDEILGQDGHVAAVRFQRADGGAETLAADMVFKAIGQKLDDSLLPGSGLTVSGGRIVADADGRTGVPGLYAGGDCRAGGQDLTVQAVEDGKRAATAIHADLMQRRA
jgi:glutamate synthase (NADPH/NADH) small chain